MAKITLADGMTIEGTAEELRELAKVFGEVAEDFDLRTKDEAEETPQDVREGDYVVFEKNGYDTSAGKPYKVTEVEFIDDSFAIIDDVEDEHWFDSDGEESPYKLYRPIEGAPQVGDKILVVDVDDDRYDNGDIFTVDEVSPSGNARVTSETRRIYLILRREFVIVERAVEEDVEETIEVGDIVRTDEGKLHEVVCVREPGYIHADKGVTLKDSENPNGIRWKFIKNCEIVVKASDRKDV